MRTLVLAAAVLAGGCAQSWNIPGLAAGTPRDEVIARAGQPTAVVPLPNGGQRLQYTLQPLGRYAYMVDLDASGRVVSARQVLTANEFQRIDPGHWTRADVEREFGPPARVDRVTSFPGDVMTYRWLEGHDPMYYWVYVDASGVVQRAHPGMEFLGGTDGSRK